MNIQKNIPLASHTTFKIGGPAKFFAEVKNEKEIIEALNYAKKNNLKRFILAGGSNILVSDKGFNGLVIKIHNTAYKIRDAIIECDAGVELSKIVVESVKNNLTGLEWANGIPGTIGGAIRGNAGAFGGCMADTIRTAKVLNVDSLQTETYSLERCEFGYRVSAFKQNQDIIILSAILELEKGDAEKNQQKIKNIIVKRKERQPRFSSAGSFFKNPIVSDKKIIEKFESEAGLKIKDDKIPAGWFIEEVDLGGKKIGGAQVSEKHNNVIINTSNATAEDVIILSSIIKQKVRKLFNVQLMEEVQLVGF